MIIKVTRNVPGYVEYAVLRSGDVVDVPEGSALSLVADGYAEEVIRETPVEAAERRDGTSVAAPQTAVVAPRGRPRRKS